VHNGLAALEETHHYWHGEKVAKGATASGGAIHNMPFPANAENVYAAIMAVDKLGATL
jgi:glycerol dehydrogenase